MIRGGDRMGWQCPGCGKVNSPDVKACDHLANISIHVPFFAVIGDGEKGQQPIAVINRTEN